MTTPHQQRDLSGAPASQPWHRSKAISVLLAVFLGPCTWLYTYRKNAGKASVGLGLDVGILAPALALTISVVRAAKEAPVGTRIDPSPLVAASLFLLFVVCVSMWIWAILDTTLKPKEWYAIGRMERTKETAVRLAVSLGLWTWLYSYSRDAWKFWLGLFVNLGGAVLAGLAADPDAQVGWLVASVLIWIGAMVNVAARSKAWYESAI